MHLTIGVLNTTNDNREFLDKIQLTALGIHHLTIYHTLEALDLITLCNRHSHSGHGIKQVRSSSFHFFNTLLQVKSSRGD